MSLDLFYRWATFNKVQPFTPDRADMRMVPLTLIGAALGGNKKLKPEDLIYSDRKDGKRPQPPAMTADAMRSVLFGGTEAQARKMGINPKTLYGKTSDSINRNQRQGSDDAVPAGDEAGQADSA